MSDAIDRQAAIDAVNMLSYHSDKYVMDGEQHGFCTGIAVAERQLELMPSVQPDNDMINLQKEQAYLQGWEEGREALRKEMWEDGRDRLD